MCLEIKRSSHCKGFDHVSHSIGGLCSLTALNRPWLCGGQDSQPQRRRNDSDCAEGAGAKSTSELQDLGAAFNIYHTLF